MENFSLVPVSRSAITQSLIDIVVRKTKKGRKYYGCMGNPECDFMSWQKPSDKKCPRCGKMMLEKGNKLVCEDRECGYMENRPEE